MKYGVYIVDGNVRCLMFEGTEKECEEFVFEMCPSWTWRDGNSFVWGVEIEELSY